MRWRKTAAIGTSQLGATLSLVRFVEEVLRESGVSRLFQEQRSSVSLQLRLRGGGGSLLLTLLRPNSLLTGKNTGNFVNLVGPFRP